MSLQDKDLFVVPISEEGKNTNEQDKNSNGYTAKDRKKIPRTMKSIDTNNDTQRITPIPPPPPPPLPQNIDDPIENRNYRYDKDIHYNNDNDNSQDDSQINQLLLKDLSQDISNKDFLKKQNKIKSISHPYNKNRDKKQDANKRRDNRNGGKENKFDSSFHTQTTTTTMSPNDTKSKTNKPFYRTSLGDWIFQETVGAGSMGKVKLAKHTYTNELCAIKVVNRATKNFLHKQQHLPPPKDKLETQEREKKLQKEISRDKRTIREASLGQILNHPNICKLYEMCTLSNHFYMIFEYISGGQLLDYIIQHGSLKEIQARKIARSIASALQYLHANNIVHRDLKIENIMISKEGEIKLIDFGLSNLYNNKKHLHTFCGSLYFAAPELLRAQPYIGPEIDIWSFGVILYVLVCGKVPFDDENSSVLHEKIKRGKVIYPSFLSIEIISLLTRMLVVNPFNRATLKEVVNHHWMVHGYNNTPPDSYLHWRSPLTPSNIQNKVIDEMYHLEFVDDIQQTRKKLIDIIKSDEYIELSIEHEKLFAYSHMSPPPQTTSTIPYINKFNIAFDDPLMGYHPLLSIYYLTMEWLERKGNMSKDEKQMNNLIHDLTHTDEETIKTKSEPLLKSKINQIEIKTNNYSTTKEPDGITTTTITTSTIPNEIDHNKNKITTATIQDNNDINRPKHILIPPKLTTKAKVCASPTRKNHYDPSDNAIPTMKTLQKNNSNNNRTTKPQGIHDTNKITNLLRRFSVKVNPTHKEDEISLPLTQTTSTPHGPTTLTDQFNNLKRNLELQNKHSRTMSENDGTTMKILNLFDSSASNNKEGIQTAKNDKFNPNTDKENVQFIDTDVHPNVSNSKRHNKNRTMSVGHARRESLKFLRPVIQNNEDAVDSNVFLEPITNDDGQDEQAVINNNTGDDRHKSEQMRKNDILSVINSNVYPITRELTDSEILEDANKAPVGSMPSIDYPRSLFLRGFFSVQTTSSKPLPIVRYKIIRVLQKMSIQFKEVKGGFICTYEIPVVDNNTIEPVTVIDPDLNSLQTSRHDEVSSETGESEPTQYPRPEGMNENVTEGSSDQYHPELFSELSNPSTRHSQYTSENGVQHVERISTINSSNHKTSSSDTFANVSEPLQSTSSRGNDVDIKVLERPIVKFEIHIVKVKIINLAGIHFKKVNGNTWIYKDLASKILKDLQV